MITIRIRRPKLGVVRYDLVRADGSPVVTDLSSGKTAQTLAKVLSQQETASAAAK